MCGNQTGFPFTGNIVTVLLLMPFFKMTPINMFVMSVVFILYGNRVLGVTQTWDDPTTGEQKSCSSICDPPNQLEKTCKIYCKGYETPRRKDSSNSTASDSNPILIYIIIGAVVSITGLSVTITVVIVRKRKRERKQKTAVDEEEHPLNQQKDGEWVSPSDAQETDNLRRNPEERLPVQTESELIQTVRETESPHGTLPIPTIDDKTNALLRGPHTFHQETPSNQASDQTKRKQPARHDQTQTIDVTADVHADPDLVQPREINDDVYHKLPEPENGPLEETAQSTRHRQRLESTSSVLDNVDIVTEERIADNAELDEPQQTEIDIDVLEPCKTIEIEQFSPYSRLRLHLPTTTV